MYEVRQKPYIIYAILESLIKKTDICANNPGTSSTTKIGEHFPCGYFMSTRWAFGYIENKYSLYCGENFMIFMKIFMKCFVLL